MFESIWRWLRNRTKQAVLGGVSDALCELDGSGEDGLDAAVQQLQARLALAAPDPEEGPAAKRKK